MVGILPSRAAPVPPPFNKGGYWCRTSAPLVKGGTPPKAEGGFRPPVPLASPFGGGAPAGGGEGFPGKKEIPRRGIGD